ncbi:class C sortase [Streptococcus ovuberis]|uniref:Class C sortase n=2 Tax=Streptococcus ovuberis TaxID=1936207 RepID=A0A7X6N0R5_9STRE|nr:class C sortase [Streptococcus ovuberis]
MIFVMVSILAYSPIHNTVAYHKQLTVSKDWSSAKEDVSSAYNDAVHQQDYATNDPFSETGKGELPVLTSLDEDGIFGYVRVPSIGLTQPLRIGATEQHLALGATIVTGTALPTGGIGNRSVIAGHRSWYDDIMFMRINELKTDDRIYIDLANQTLEYRVTESVIIPAEDWEQLKAIENKDMVTLLTCEPLYPPFDYRLLVNAERVPTVKLTLPAPATVSLSHEVITVVTKEYWLALIWILLLALLIYLVIACKRRLKMENPKSLPLQNSSDNVNG